MGVVGVVLVRPARGQQPCPRRQRGGHVNDGLARGDQLLGEQITESAGRLDCPGSSLEWPSPRHELVDLGATGSHLLAVELFLSAVDDDGRVGRLVRVDADDHWHGFLRGLV